MNTAITKAQFLALIDRTVDPSYIEPLKTGNGYELIEGYAAIAERVSLSADRLDTCCFIRTAPAGSYSTVPVQFYRQNALAGAVTVLAGTIVSYPIGNRQFVTQQDAAFGGGDLETAFVIAQAVAQGYEWNILGQQTAADGEVIPGQITDIERLQEDPPYGDPTVQVRNIDPATGGAPDSLDALGSDRGMPRFPEEPADAYRARIARLPHVVTPVALKEAISTLFAPYGVAPTFIETWEPSFVGYWDTPTANKAFIYDDPRPRPPTRGRFLGDDLYAGAFIVVIPVMQPLSMRGMCYDDPARTSGEWVSPLTGGRRASSCYDITPSSESPELLVGCYDGQDTEFNGLIFGSMDLLQNIKAGGVAFAYVLAGT